MFSALRNAASLYRITHRKFYHLDSSAILGPIIGIDFGSTKSSVAIIENGIQVKVIENAEGLHKMPSVVAFTKKDGEYAVGVAAKQQAVTNPQNTVYGIKRLIGRHFDDKQVQKYLKDVPYKIVKSENGDAWIEAHGKFYSPSQITAYVLQKLKQTAENYLGTPVENAVLTVPATFNNFQRQAMRDAGQIAGFKIVQIIDEPVAAILAYGLLRAQDKIIAVCDFGGGKFDISVIKTRNRDFEVKSVNGDASLGGEDFDNRLIQYLVDAFKKEQSTDLTKDPVAMQRIRKAAKEAKIVLSSNPHADISIPNITVDGCDAKNLALKISREEYEILVDDLLQRINELCLKALQDAGIKAANIDRILLVGGMSRMPKIQELIQQTFGRLPSKSINPDEAIVIGAAIEGAIIADTLTGVNISDIVDECKEFLKRFDKGDGKDKKRHEIFRKGRRFLIALIWVVGVLQMIVWTILMSKL